MSLTCAETGKIIAPPEEVWVGVLAGTNMRVYAALSKEALDKINENHRRPCPCVWGDRGIDVHKVFPKVNPMLETYQWTELGEYIGMFVFSVSQLAARERLPILYQQSLTIMDRDNLSV